MNIPTILATIALIILTIGIVIAAYSSLIPNNKKA